MNEYKDIDVNNMTYQEIQEHPMFKKLFRKIKEGYLLRDPKNDIFFHNLFEHLDEPECLHILKVLIKAVLGIEFTIVTLENPHMVPDTFNERSSTLDVLVKLDGKIYVNIEMQNSKLTDEHDYRFQTYIHKLASKILSRGETLVNNPCYQIVLINDIDKRNPSLIRKLKTVDNQYYVQHKRIVEFAFVHMPYIENVGETKSTDHFSEFELLIYYFYYRKDYDILDIEERMIQYMEKYLRGYSMDIGEEMALFRIEMDRKARQETEERLKLAERRVNELEQREYESSKANCMDLFQFVYPDIDPSFLNDLATDQYNLLHKAILKRKSVEELKRLLH